ncbi:MAG: lipid A biosynthesis acyltransferase [Chitinophagaceae bacterium]|nr:MAG: lipid A biosynthesis acyltransferase [Chitinophagaceae bacterium]
MANWRGRSRGNKSGYSIFVWVLKNFGVFPAYFLLRFVSFYFFLFSYTASKNTLHLYRKRLGYSWLRSMGMLYNNYYRFGMSLIDKVVVMSGMRNRFSFDFDGEEHLHQMVQQGNGGLLLSAHVGNWEIAGHLLKRLGTTINIVMFDGEQQQIKQYLSTVTGARAVNVIVIKNDISHIYEISEALSRKELVCIHADRFVEGNKTLMLDFVGSPAKFPVGPFVLAATFRVPVSFVFAMKESDLHYHFFATPDQTDTTLSKVQLTQKLARGFADEMENKLKTYPEQWYNFYNFWQ